MSSIFNQSVIFSFKVGPTVNFLILIEYPTKLPLLSPGNNIIKIIGYLCSFFSGLILRKIHAVKKDMYVPKLWSVGPKCQTFDSSYIGISCFL